MRSNGPINGFARRAPRLALMLVAACLVESCAGHRTISREELRSDLTAAASLASETEMSIDFVLRGQVTHNFAVGHFHYLARQLSDLEKQVAGATPEEGLEQNLASGRTQMDALSSVLTTVAANTKQPGALRAAKQRAQAIRAALEHEEPAR